MRSFMVLLFGFGCWTFARERVILRIEPLDFQDDSVWETLVQEIKQLETDGNRLVIRSENPHLIQLDREGRFLGTVGPVTVGNDQRSQPIAAFQMYGDKFVMVNMKNDIFVWEEYALIAHAQSDYYLGKYAFPYLNANTFAFDGNRFVLPAHPGKGFLAVVHDVHKKLVHKIPDPEPIPGEIMALANGMGGTFWGSDGEYWYALYKFQPMILKFDRNFQLKNRFEITGSEVGAAWERLFNQKNLADNRIPRPLFSDFKVHGGSLFVMCDDALYQIDSRYGEVNRIYRIIGTGPDFGNLPPGQWLTIPYFAIFEDGAIVLGHPAQPWNHDLWTAQLVL